MTRKIYTDDICGLVIENPETKHIHGSGHKVVSFKLNDEKTGVVAIEECDGYFDVTLNSNDIDRLIRKLKLLKKQLKPQRIKLK